MICGRDVGADRDRDGEGSEARCASDDEEQAERRQELGEDLTRVGPGMAGSPEERRAKHHVRRCDSEERAGDLAPEVRETMGSVSAFVYCWERL